MPKPPESKTLENSWKWFHDELKNRKEATGQLQDQAIEEWFDSQMDSTESLSKEDLIKIVKWKLARGKFRF
jgi:hypothetical protein